VLPVLCTTVEVSDTQASLLHEYKTQIVHTAEVAYSAVSERVVEFQ